MTFFRPQTVQSLLSLLEENTDAVLLAGGTDLLVGIHREQTYPETMVYLGSLGWNTIERHAGHYEIGSMVTAGQLAAYNCPEMDILSRAASQVGGVQIRNMATIGGNVVNASPAADMALVLVALDAEATLIGKTSERRIPVRDFITGPGQTVLSKNEVVRSFRVPIVSGNTVQWFRKVGPRGRYYISRVAVGAVASIDGGMISNIRIALGSVAPKPVRATHTERYLKGAKTIGETEIGKAARMASTEDCIPISDHRSSEGYRRRVIHNLVRQFLYDTIAAEG